jgi:lysophospholipase L1-like esterase
VSANFQVPRGVVSTVTANATLAKGKHTPVDATSGAITMTLPTGATPGSVISVEKVDSSPNIITVSGSIRGAASSVTLVWQFETVEFVADSAGSWRPVAGHKTKAAFDAVYAPVKKARSARNLPRLSLPYVPFPPQAFEMPTLSGSNSDPNVAHPTVYAIPVTPSTTVQGPITADPCLVHGSVAYAVDSNGNVTTAMPHGVTAPPQQFEWITDSPLFALKIGNFNTSGFYVFVNDEMVYSNDANPGFGTTRLVVDWTGFTEPRRPRHYRIVTGNGFAMSGFVGDVTDTFWAPRTANRIKLGWIGDSYSQGYQGIPYLTGRLLGWDIEIDSTDGGTGYQTAAAGSTFLTRVPDMVAAAPDVVVVAGGINDAAPGLQAAATSVLSGLRAGLPDAPIYVVGPWCPPGSTYSAQSAKYTAMQGAVAAVSNCIFIDPHTWFTGTGNTSNIIGDGNSDVYIQSDNTHPNTVGRSYLAGRMADAIAATQSY